MANGGDPKHPLARYLREVLLNGVDPQEAGRRHLKPAARPRTRSQVARNLADLRKRLAAINRAMTPRSPEEQAAATFFDLLPGGTALAPMLAAGRRAVGKVVGKITPKTASELSAALRAPEQAATVESLVARRLAKEQAELDARLARQAGLPGPQASESQIQNTIIRSSPEEIAELRARRPDLFAKEGEAATDWWKRRKDALGERGAPAARTGASEFARQSGLGELPPVERVTQVDKDVHTRTAKAYGAAQSAPNDPQVRAAYEQFAREVERQYDYMTNVLGVNVVPAAADPYKNSAEMIRDVVENNRLRVFTESSEHPLLTSEQNVKFRAIHDYFAHAGPGNQFGPVGEENAFREHVRMFSPRARAAMATETRGQNSWVNFGPHSSKPVSERPFAEQKVFLLPENLRAPTYYIAPTPVYETIVEQGGATLDPVTRAPAQVTGYVVANPKFTRKLTPEEGSAVVEAWLQQPDVQERLRKPGAHIGGWRNPQTGVLEVNVTDIVPDETAARALGAQRGQKTIGQLREGEYVGDIAVENIRIAPTPGAAANVGTVGALESLGDLPKPLAQHTPEELAGVRERVMGRLREIEAFPETDELATMLKENELRKARFDLQSIDDVTRAAPTSAKPGVQVEKFTRRKAKQPGRELFRTFVTAPDGQRFVLSGVRQGKNVEVDALFAVDAAGDLRVGAEDLSMGAFGTRGLRELGALLRKEFPDATTLKYVRGGSTGGAFERRVELPMQAMILGFQGEEDTPSPALAVAGAVLGGRRGGRALRSRSAALAARALRVQEFQGAMLQDELARIERDLTGRLRGGVEAAAEHLMGTEDAAQLALAGAPAAGGFQRTTEAFVGNFGPDAERFALIASAYSPRLPVPVALDKALDVFETWVRAGRPLDPASARRIVGTRPMAGHRENLMRALTAAPGADPFTVLSGPKVQSFASNLLGDVRRVTHDVWRTHPELLSHRSLDSRIGATAAGGRRLASGQYIGFAARDRLVADYLGTMTGHPWTPVMAQETSWAATKDLVEGTAGGAFTGPGAVRSPVPLRERIGTLDPQRMRQAWDIPGLLVNAPQMERLAAMEGGLLGGRVGALPAWPDFAGTPAPDPETLRFAADRIQQSLLGRTVWE